MIALAIATACTGAFVSEAQTRGASEADSPITIRAVNLGATRGGHVSAELASQPVTVEVAAPVVERQVRCILEGDVLDSGQIPDPAPHVLKNPVAR